MIPSAFSVIQVVLDIFEVFLIACVSRVPFRSSWSCNLDFRFVAGGPKRRRTTSPQSPGKSHADDDFTKELRELKLRHANELHQSKIRTEELKRKIAVSLFDAQVQAINRTKELEDQLHAMHLQVLQLKREKSQASKFATLLKVQKTQLELDHTQSTLQNSASSTGQNL